MTVLAVEGDRYPQHDESCHHQAAAEHDDENGEGESFGGHTRNLLEWAPRRPSYRCYGSTEMPFKSQAQRRKFAELLVKGKISSAVEVAPP